MPRGTYNHALIVTPSVYSQYTGGARNANKLYELSADILKHSDRISSHLSQELTDFHEDLSVKLMASSQTLPAHLWSDPNKLTACCFSIASRLIFTVTPQTEKVFAGFAERRLVPLLSKPRKLNGRPDWKRRFIVVTIGSATLPLTITKLMPPECFIHFASSAFHNEMETLECLVELIEDVWIHPRVMGKRSGQETDLDTINNIDNYQCEKRMSLKKDITLVENSNDSHLVDNKTHVKGSIIPDNKDEQKRPIKDFDWCESEIDYIDTQVQGEIVSVKDQKETIYKATPYHPINVVHQTQSYSALPNNVNYNKVQDIPISRHQVEQPIVRNRMFSPNYSASEDPRSVSELRKHFVREEYNESTIYQKSIEPEASDADDNSVFGTDKTAIWDMLRKDLQDKSKFNAIFYGQGNKKTDINKPPPIPAKMPEEDFIKNKETRNQNKNFNSKVVQTDDITIQNDTTSSSLQHVPAVPNIPIMQSRTEPIKSVESHHDSVVTTSEDFRTKSVVNSGSNPRKPVRPFESIKPISAQKSNSSWVSNVPKPDDSTFISKQQQYSQRSVRLIEGNIMDQVGPNDRVIYVKSNSISKPIQEIRLSSPPSQEINAPKVTCKQPIKKVPSNTPTPSSLATPSSSMRLTAKHFKRVDACTLVRPPVGGTWWPMSFSKRSSSEPAEWQCEKFEPMSSVGAISSATRKLIILREKAVYTGPDALDTAKQEMQEFRHNTEYNCTILTLSQRDDNNKVLITSDVAGMKSVDLKKPLNRGSRNGWCLKTLLFFCLTVLLATIIHLVISQQGTLSENDAAEPE